MIFERRSTALTRPLKRPLVAVIGLMAVASCGPLPDFDLRSGARGLDTSSAAQQVTSARPEPDDRGVIAYPSYQVAVARSGDTIASVAARVGVPVADLARQNSLQPETELRVGEVLLLPEGVVAGGNGPVDIASIATSALSRNSASGAGAPVQTGAVLGQGALSSPLQSAKPASAQLGQAPLRHTVLRGETAFTIARLYNVSARSLADWNGLGSDFVVREGQVLLIPTAADDAPAPTPVLEMASAPGQGSVTPPPPSAALPLPVERPARAQVAAKAPAPAASVAAKPAAALAVPKPVAPPSPNMATETTAASAARFAFPTDGKVIRPYAKGKNEGIDIAATAGMPVRAAADGTVTFITQDTEQVSILVLRHADNMVTVYANVDAIKVKKGDVVTRGQAMASVRAGNPAFVHFELRKGVESLDPMPFLQ
ncbi:MAG: LysM peptidoglycan-binding domain-containing M23 family metallopeptidase [Paracoccaceae bacterium]|nr:LysM peptidoglycan-binding domain-containing M23 family metallopeptidase [Paracoccaceae bacterium]